MTSPSGRILYLSNRRPEEDFARVELALLKRLGGAVEAVFSIPELLGVLQPPPAPERACTATRVGLPSTSDDKR